MRIEVLRRSPGEKEGRWEQYTYSPGDPSETVASALSRLNESLERPIRWEQSCLQKKCGACAMVINGRPGLACAQRLNSLKEPLRLEPLRKFPVVEDLLVDRGGMFRRLEQLRLWLDREVRPEQRSSELAYEASRCLQCGCCLEVCPNFCPDGAFSGMASAIPASRLLAELPKTARGELAAQYREKFYAGCGKSLACRNICPAGIDIDRVAAASNAAAVWKWLR